MWLVKMIMPSLSFSDNLFHDVNNHFTKTYISLICCADICHTIFQIDFVTFQIFVLLPHVPTKAGVLWMGPYLLASDVCVLLNGLAIHALNVSTKIKCPYSHCNYLAINVKFRWLGLLVQNVCGKFEVGLTIFCKMKFAF